MNFEQQNERYMNDPLFHAIVDMLHNFLHEGKATVGELRDAATFAGIMFESFRVRTDFPGSTTRGKPWI